MVKRFHSIDRELTPPRAVFLSQQGRLCVYGFQSRPISPKPNLGPTEYGLLHLMAGPKEDAETVSAFFQDMRSRGLGERWRAIKLTDFERRQMGAIRKELDPEYEAESGLAKKSSKGLPTHKLSSSSQT